MPNGKPSKVDKIINRLKDLDQRVGVLDSEVGKEYSKAARDYKRALKASMAVDPPLPEPEMPDLFLGRFATFTRNYSHFRGNALVFIGMSLKKLEKPDLSADRKVDAYQTIIKQGKRVAEYFGPAAQALLDEIQNNPDRTKSGEEPMRERITGALEKMIPLCDEIGSAANGLQSALGIGVEEDRRMGGSPTR